MIAYMAIRPALLRALDARRLAPLAAALPLLVLGACDDSSAGSGPEEPGGVLFEFEAPGTRPAGLAWDGTNVWVMDLGASAGSGVLFRLTRSGSVLGSAPVTVMHFPGGLAWDGTDLWALTSTTLVKLTPAGERLAYVPVTRSGREGFCGLSASGRQFWISECIASGLVCRVDPEGRRDGCFPIDPLRWGEPRGVGSDGNSVWVGTSNGRIHRFSVDGEWRETFSAPGPSPAGLTWSDGVLWILDSETRRIYGLSVT